MMNDKSKTALVSETWTAATRRKGATLTNADRIRAMSDEELAALQSENEKLKKRVEVKETMLKLYETTLSLVAGDKDTAIHRMRKAEAALAEAEAAMGGGGDG